MSHSICWLRRDLRLTDHAALAVATHASESVAAVFVFDTRILKALTNRGDRRLTFIHRTLEALDADLRKKGSVLIVRHGDPAEEIPRLAAELGAGHVFAARDYEPYARERDKNVGAVLKAQGIEFTLVKDSVILEAGEVLSQEGNPLRVYSPYRRSWQKTFVAERDAAEHRPDLDRLRPLDPRTARMPTLADLGFDQARLWLQPGPAAAQRQLSEFAQRLDRYAEDRDFPAKNATSALSVHLRFGTISVRELVRLAISLGSEGASAWLNEIIWRDFYQDILFHFPDVVQQPFQGVYKDLDYPGLDEHFDAWCEGQTGYPIVDAAMRCFNATGWMHNRLRMVVASFLTKDLLIDYRRGEKYFADGLLDFDLASNNGGWQWAASVGADPQPYFRIFNPVLQSEKFDASGEFIQQWCPELGGLEGSALHFPARTSEFELLAAGVRLGEDYPRPIVDHAVQKEKAVALLRTARGS